MKVENSEKMVVSNNDHDMLINKDLADQHPISAITGLKEELDSLNIDCYVSSATVDKRGNLILTKELSQDFTELSYIESTGTQFIDTGVIPSDDLRLEIDVQFTSIPTVKEHAFVNGFTIGSPTRVAIGIANRKPGQILFATGSIENWCGSNIDVTSRHIYINDLKNQKAYIDDTEYSTPHTFSYSGKETIPLFARRSNPYGHMAYELYCKEKLYSAKKLSGSMLCY